MPYLGNVLTSFNVGTNNINNDAVTTEKIADGAIINADVNALAAIAGTKISPNFGSQTVVTTGIFSAAGGAAATPSIAFTGDLNTGIYSPGADQVAISTGGTGRLFVDASGRVLVGTSTSRSVGAERLVQIEGTSATTTNLSITRNQDNNTTPAVLELAFSRGTTTGSNTVVQSGDQLGAVIFRGADGSALTSAAEIRAEVDGTPGANDMPGRLVFSTTADGSTSPTERMRLDSSGRLGLGTSTVNANLHVSNTAGDSEIRITAKSTNQGILRFGNEVDQTLASIRFDSTDDSFRFYGLNDTERVRISGTGAVGIGTTSPNSRLDVRRNDAHSVASFTQQSGSFNCDIAIDHTSAPSTFLISRRSSGDTWFYQAGAYNLVFSTNSTERARIDSSGRLLVGTSTSRGGWFNTTGQDSLIQTETTAQNVFSGVQNSNSALGPWILLGKSRGTTAGAVTAVQNDDPLGGITFQGADGTEMVDGARIQAFVDGSPGANDLPTRLVFSTTADGASSPTERMRIANNGKFSLNTVTAVNNGTEAWRLNCGASDFCARFFGVTGGGESQANCAMGISKDNSTNRSINAGGTINASGADYAEYMTKAGDFTIAKGDICGVDANGKLTNVFSDAVGFVVKSTNPSYIGGDTWGTEDVVGAKPSDNEPELLAEWEAALEAERQKVDRIAFAGQVPVNVTGANPGQYIIPVESNGGISGIAKDEADLTLTEYMKAVGKVIAIEDDGRARIIVKVA